MSAANDSSRVDSLRERGLPTARDEDWKYAPVRVLARRDWWALPTDALSFPDTAAIDAATLPVDAPRLVFAGGHAVPLSAGGFGALPAGVTLRPLPEAALASSAKTTLTDTPAARIELIAAATSPGGWELVVAAGVDAGSLQLCHLPAAGAGSLVLRLKLERGARLTLIESMAGSTSTNATLTRWIQAKLAENSVLTQISVQWLPTDVALLEQVDVTLARDATYHAFACTLGGQAAHTAARVTLEGVGANAHWNQLLRVAGTQHTDSHLTMTHAAPQTRSTQTVRALADGRGRGAFSGKVVMVEGAKGADSAQSIRNLLLCATAELDTRPQLEIHVDEVKASHGTTTGSLDEQALFYLRSRGIDEPEARRLLTQAFTAEVISRVPVPALRDWLTLRVLP